MGTLLQAQLRGPPHTFPQLLDPTKRLSAVFKNWQTLGAFADKRSMG